MQRERAGRRGGCKILPCKVKRVLGHGPCRGDRRGGDDRGLNQAGGAFRSSCNPDVRIEIGRRAGTQGSDFLDGPEIRAEAGKVGVRGGAGGRRTAESQVQAVI